MGLDGFAHKVKLVNIALSPAIPALPSEPTSRDRTEQGVKGSSPMRAGTLPLSATDGALKVAHDL